MDFAETAPLEEWPTTWWRAFTPSSGKTAGYSGSHGRTLDPLSDLYPAAVAVSNHLRKGLRAVHDASLEIADRHRLPADDKPATIGAVASMIIGSALLEDWAYPANKRIPGRTRMIREISTLIVDGTTHRDGTSPDAPSPR